MSEASIDAWTAYWRSGQLASCFQGDQQAPELARLWREFAAQLAPNAALIDLAAGAGAATRACIAAAAALDKPITIDAVDAADIAPPPLGAQSVRFHARVRLESLPFDDASFDAALSQFGFEYADEAPASAELARVLRPRGHALLLLHARESAVFADIEARVRRLRAALDGDGPIALARTLARAHAEGDSPALQRADAMVPTALAMLREWAGAAPTDDAALFYGGAMLEDWRRRERYWPADLRRAIEAGFANAEAVALRQEGMLAAARSEADIASLSSRLTALGLDPAPPTAVRDAGGAQIAWRLAAQKRA